ncbi:MAG: hypothetical protein F4145_11200 [Boseongicola sp. SB0675_bin_26]|nr:hypothetical protein [Boseongicola sp. SB0675_bin_26]
MQEPSEEFDPNDTGEPVAGMEPNDGTNLEDVLGQAWDKTHEGGPEPGDEPGNAGPGKDGADASGGKPDEGGDPPQSMEAPANWSSEHREMFSKLDLEAQKFLMDRSQAMEAAHTQRSQEVAPFREVADKWSGYMQQAQTTPALAFDSLMGIEYRLRTGTPAQQMDVLREIISAYGIAPPQTDDGGNVIEPVRDERVDGLMNEIQQLRQQSHGDMQARQHAEMQRQQNTINDFMTAKNEDGTLAHPFFSDVEHEMTRLAQADHAAGKQPDIRDLYERACWSNPAVRAKLLEAEDRAKAEAARRKRNAGSSVSGAGSPRTEQPKDLKAALSEAYDQMVAA